MTLRMPSPVKCHRTAEQFLRCEHLGVRTRLMLDKAEDWLEIVVKGKNQEGDVSWRTLGTLSICDREMRERKFIALAAAAYRFWLTLDRDDEQKPGQ
jgi:hypothetical protein